MASYTITTTRKQEIGLKFSYDNYANKEEFPTQQAWFQNRINLQVLDAMYAEQQRAQAVSFDQSFMTVPELQQPTARTEIEGVITTHGGTIIPPGPINVPPVNPTNKFGGALPLNRGTSGNPIQIGGSESKTPGASRPDGGGDNDDKRGDGQVKS